MELTYAFVSDTRVSKALQNLFEAKFNGSTILNVTRMRRILSNELTNFQQDFREVAKKYADLDDKGEFKFMDGPYGIALKEGGLAELAKIEQELLKEKFELEGCKKIHFSNIESCKGLTLSATDLEVLEPILDGLDLPSLKAADVSESKPSESPKAP